MSCTSAPLLILLIDTTNQGKSVLLLTDVFLLEVLLSFIDGSFRDIGRVILNYIMQQLYNI